MHHLDQHQRAGFGQGNETPYQSPLASKRTESVPKYFSARRYLSGELAAELDDRPENASRLRDGGGSGGGYASPGDFPARVNSSGEGRRPMVNSNHFASHIVPISRSPSPYRMPEQPKEQLRQVKLHSSLELLSILASLTTFGILGVLIRYYTEKLFGPKVAKLTSNDSPLFLDLPANMLGSFFMGWVGVVFKTDIAGFYDHLAVGLSTGLMGCITTYASMIQRNVALMVKGKWVMGFFGILAGMYLSQMSLIVGIDSALLFRRFLRRLFPKSFPGLEPDIEENEAIQPDQQFEMEIEAAEAKSLPSSSRSAMSIKLRRLVMLLLFLTLGGGLWGITAVLAFVWDKGNLTRRTLWLACVVGPPGVWVRWLLSELNGSGFVGGGRGKRFCRWLPLGTLLANVGASSIEAGLSVVQLWRARYTWTLAVNAINLGTMGCLSTVSTFVTEIQFLHEYQRARWRAYFYPLFTILLSLAISIPAYGVPVWIKNYNT